MINSPSVSDSPQSPKPSDGSSFPDLSAPLPQQPVRVSVPQRAPYVTYALIGITSLFYVLQILSIVLFSYPSASTNMDWLEFYGARINEFIQAGQIWRLITPALLHGSIMHIFFNMYALFILGTNLERYFGHGRFLLLYWLAAFTGNVASFLFTSGYSVGASTAIFGIIGAEGVFLFQNRKLFGNQARRAIGNVIFVIVINLFIIGSLQFIDKWGHIGGLLGGVMFTALAGPLWDVEVGSVGQGHTLVDKRPTRDVLISAAAVVFVFSALAFWGMMR